MDIVALPRREKIAIEIEMSPGHVAENVEKDLEAGFDSVVSLLEDPRAIDRVGKSLSKEMDEHPQGVVMGELRDFEEILSSLGSPSSTLWARRTSRHS